MRVPVFRRHRIHLPPPISLLYCLYQWRRRSKVYIGVIVAKRIILPRSLLLLLFGAGLADAQNVAQRT
jgi:hypothetical protein